MSLANIKQLIKHLRPNQREKLFDWLQNQISVKKGSQISSVSIKKESAKNKQAGNKTYRKELIKCGKKGCKCNDGKLHGPYFYAYWSEGGMTKSQYIGKQMPKGIKNQLKRDKDESIKTRGSFTLGQRGQKK